MKNKMLISLMALGLALIAGTDIGFGINAALGSGDSPSVSTEPAQAKRGGLVCLNSAARFDKWNRAAVR